MEYGVDISVVVKNKDQFEYWLGALPFYNNIQKEGIVLMQYQYLEQLREKSNYNDFYIASKAQAEEQYNTAKYTLEQVKIIRMKSKSDYETMKKRYGVYLFFFLQRLTISVL